MAIHAEDIEYEGLNGYLARPDKGGQAGVLLLPSHWGVNDRTREQVDSLAEAGLTALAWNQYTGFEIDPNEPIGQVSARLRDPVALEQTSTWVTYLLDEAGVTAVGAIGFCAGGRFGLMQCAQDARINAFACFYPTLKTPLGANQVVDAVAGAPEIACPVLLIQPGQDGSTKPEMYATLTQHLLGRRAPTTIAYYPGATHAFMGISGEPSQANDEAIRVAWPQALSFLTTWLAGPRSGSPLSSALGAAHT